MKLNLINSDPGESTARHSGLDVSYVFNVGILNMCYYITTTFLCTLIIDTLFFIFYTEINTQRDVSCLHVS